MALPKPSEYAIQRAIVMNRADADVLAALRQAQENVHRMLREVDGRPGVGAALRKAQLQLIKRNVQQEMANLWRKVGDITQAKRLEAANKLIDLNEVSDRLRLVTAGVPGGADIARAIADAERDAAERAIDRMTARAQGASHKPLSDQVYTSQTGLNGQLDRMLNSALATGLSAREFAATIQNFINPNTPGGARYAALRTARTEINNAAHAVAIDAVQDKPWVDSMTWNLSGSHKRADVCNSLAAGGPKNDGIYPKGAVPAKPHPQCFCYVTPNTLDDDEFMDGLLSGKFDGYLDKYKNLQPGQVVRSNFPGGSQGVVAPPKTPVIKVKPPVAPTPPKKPAKTAKPKTPKPAAPTPQTATSGLQDFVDRKLKSNQNPLDIMKDVQTSFGLSPAESQKVVVGRLQGAASSQTAPRTTLLPPRAPINTMRNPDHKKIIGEEMDRQKVLVPKAYSKLRSVNDFDPNDVAFGNGDALGVYYHGQQRIQINAKIFSDDYKVAFRREVENGWCTPCGHDHSAPQSIFAHEFGHHVDWVMKQTPSRGRGVWNAIADELGVDPPDILSRTDLDVFVKANKARLATQVSRYGATDSAEILAEIWQEYSTMGPAARPFIKKIGRLMQEISERAP